MISLKAYQNDVLDSLRLYFKKCARSGDPAASFLAVQEERFARIALDYHPVEAEGLDTGMPYVCVRVPTGGGKTLLAAHAVGIAMKDLLHADHAAALWLVPSNTILDQTVNALRDPRHAYRRALELECGPVEVYTVAEALNLSAAATRGQTVVIVGTIQSFRVEDTTGRKVYEQNGALAEHLLNLPADALARLEPGPDGKPIPSLVNVLRLHRPIVIVDEAHNARTDLSFATLGNVRPSCIFEFTATPAREHNPSNVLYQVSAAELRAADMIKLPLRVIQKPVAQKEELLAEAITLRNHLETLATKEAQHGGDYLRPMLLVQAEKVDACEPLRKRLADDYKIPAEQIKISVGSKDELEAIADINSPDCPVRVIITVQKLREGWDCPFAYVLCSLRNTSSATAIEQIVGRILRQPGARQKPTPELNCSYAFSVSDSLLAVLADLREALVNNGFTSAEVASIVQPNRTGSLIAPQPEAIAFEPDEINLAKAETVVAGLEGKATIDPNSRTITVLVPLDKSETDKLAGCAATPAAKAKIREAAKAVEESDRAFGGTGETRAPSPYERKVEFAAPRLAVRENGNLIEFAEDFLLEREWKLSEKSADLPTSYNPRQRPVGQTGSVNIDERGSTTTRVEGIDFVYNLHQQVLAFDRRDDWTQEDLIAWLDRHIPHTDIPAEESAAFLVQVINGVRVKFPKLDMGTLALDRFRLRDLIEDLIDRHRSDAKKSTFDEYLFPNSPLEVDDSFRFDFRRMSYEPSEWYKGAFQFRKHYFPRPGELPHETSAGKPREEFACAVHLDGLPAVECWIRNLVRKPSAFRLLTSKDWFYPDFVCKLKDGRILVVEYKGRHLMTDAAEKRAVGAVWESRSKGRCLFVMPTASDFSEIDRRIGA